MKYWGFIKDPLYGYVHITEVEKKIIDTLPFQRLHRIKQLVFADYVYPGATHTRFEHSIGVMHLAGLLASSLPEQLSPEEIQEVLRSPQLSLFLFQFADYDSKNKKPRPKDKIV